MIKYCILVAILTESFTLSAQVKIVRDTLYAEPASMYDMLQAVGYYYHMKLELKGPRDAYNRMYYTTLALSNRQNLQEMLALFHAQTGMDYIIKKDTLALRLRWFGK